MDIWSSIIGLLRLFLSPDSQSRRVTLYYLSVAIYVLPILHWHVAYLMDCQRHWWWPTLFKAHLSSCFFYCISLSDRWFLLPGSWCIKLHKRSCKWLCPLSPKYKVLVFTHHPQATSQLHTQNGKKKNFLHLQTGHVIVVHKYWFNRCIYAKSGDKEIETNDKSGPSTSAVLHYQLCHQSTFASWMFSCCSLNIQILGLSGLCLEKSNI